MFEAVILSLLVTFCEKTFIFWAEILFLPKINMEVETRMESILLFQRRCH